MLVGLRIIKLSHSPGHGIDCSAFGSYDSAHLMGSEMPLAHRDILWATNKPQQKKGQTGERSCLPLPVTVPHLKSSLWFASGPRLSQHPNTGHQVTCTAAPQYSISSWGWCTWIQGRGSGKHKCPYEQVTRRSCHFTIFPSTLHLWLAAVSL